MLSRSARGIDRGSRACASGCDTASKLNSGPSCSHVQVVAEASFDKLRDFQSLRYVRGCSGFAGFARQSFTREFVEDISAQMQTAIGAGGVSGAASR